MSKTNWWKKSFLNSFYFHSHPDSLTAIVWDAPRAPSSLPAKTRFIFTILRYCFVCFSSFPCCHRCLRTSFFFIFLGVVSRLYRISFVSFFPITAKNWVFSWLVYVLSSKQKIVYGSSCAKWLNIEIIICFFCLVALDLEICWTF